MAKGTEFIDPNNKGRSTGYTLDVGRIGLTFD